MIDTALLERLQCLTCEQSPLRTGGSPERAVVCPGCGSAYPVRDGILDTLPEGPGRNLRFATRVLHLGIVIRVYERYWRPALCRLVTKTTFPYEAGVIKRMLDIGGRKQVLDIGGGTGLFARSLARELRGGEIVCLDISESMLRQARALALSEGLKNLSFIRGDAARLPFRPGAFDGVNCCGALHLFNDIPGALAQIERVLLPDGRFSCLTFTRGRHPVTRRVFGAARRLIGMEFFELHVLRSLLEQAGFRDYCAEACGLMVIFSVSK